MMNASDGYILFLQEFIHFVIIEKISYTQLEILHQICYVYQLGNAETVTYLIFIIVLTFNTQNCTPNDNSDTK